MVDKKIISTDDILGLMDKKTNIVKEKVEKEVITQKEEVIEEAKKRGRPKKEETVEESVYEDQTILYKAELEALKVQLDSIKKETAEEKKRLEDELKNKYKNIEKKAADYDKLVEEEEDKKRTLEERLLIKEKALVEQEAEYQARLQAREIEYNALRSDLETANLKVETINNYWKDMLEKELEDIDPDFREPAQIIINGMKDSHKALEKIRSFKDKGLFKKTREVPVVHDTPTVKDGVRSDSPTYQQKNRDTMKSSEKQKIGLDEWIRNKKPYMGRNR